MTAYAFLAIPLVFFLCVRFGPMLYAMGRSLTDWSLLRHSNRFIGLENFKAVLEDPVFMKALGNTLTYALIGSPLVIAISLGIAEYRIGESREALIDRADRHLYVAKESGRNRAIDAPDD